jgi:hypothetical protein
MPWAPLGWYEETEVLVGVWLGRREENGAMTAALGLLVMAKVGATEKPSVGSHFDGIELDLVVD